ncbi:MAG TPA: RHS repeat-associated core domain-containing protein [Puia sp.]|nr:RHS repeat-associated core domain-containing protein [Puia sp.]
MARLYRFASAGCDADHLFGASTLPPGVSSPLGGGETSFQDVIKGFNVSKGYSDDLHCNAEQITMPGPYDKQPAYALKPVYTRPSDCECKLITDMYNMYQASGSALSFSGYLQQTQQITMTDADLATLRSLCANTTNSASCINISHPILLPPAMQCYVGPTCASCETVRSVYRSYLQDYPSDTPKNSLDVDTTQEQKNLLFQNYMNSRLGFSKQAWEYLQFLDTCAAHSDTTDVQKCTNTIADMFQTSGKDVMLDMKRTADGGYIMVGSTTRPGRATDAYIIRYDSSNNIQWAKTYGGTEDDIFWRVRATSDGGYVAVGTTFSDTSLGTGEVMAVKLSANGSTMWKKSFGFDRDGSKGFDITQTSDGGYAIVGDYNIDSSNNMGSEGSGMLVIRTDSGGNISWARQIKVDANGCDGYGIRQIGDTLFVTGRNLDKPNARFYGALYQLNDASGTLINEYHYSDATGSISTSLIDLYPRGTGYRVLAIRALGGSGDSCHAAVLDLTNTGQKTRYEVVDDPPGTVAKGTLNSADFTLTSDGGFLVGQSPVGVGLKNIYWTKSDSVGNPAWSRRTTLSDTQYVASIVQNSDSSYASLCRDSGIATLLRLSKTGTTSCFDSTVTIAIKNLPLSLQAQTSTDSVLTVLSVDSLIGEDTVRPVDFPITCPIGGNCYTISSGPILCGKAAPVFAPVNEPPITACTDSTFFAVSKGTVLYNNYTDSLTGDFEHQYLAECLQGYKHEVFTVTHSQREYHYTLYYYDQAGNLLKTVPPAGVDQHTDSVWMQDVRSARAAGVKKVPSHALVTNYRYNTLNQVVTQRTPDGGTSFFWYDRLGRLALSQNARQVPNNQYSYTLYDSIGRITQVGQLVSSTAPTDAITRSESSLSSWITTVASSEEQITLTTYDSANYYAIPALAAHNLRNRVAWTALYSTYSDMVAVPGNHSAATYYSYDILGNVDTLVQDYKLGSMANQLNRLKKIVYDYDLVSGKVNKVSYQHGQVDAFYHTYVYDAENRITNVQSSMDSINWDNDAFYSYYAHGPLARTILGEQQVQGVNYAYTLQGWLKAINPDIYTGGSYTLRPDSAGNVVAASAYNLLLNYYNGDYRPISGAGALDNGMYGTLGADSMPLFNGNISSMGLSVRKLDNPMLYNYRYDQLNRLIHMDAWKRTGSDWSAITKISDYQEDIGYDPNGNILRYKRNGTTAGGLDMDKLQYNYTAGTNQLDHIHDTVTTSSSYDDIKSQSSGNYKYDSIGQLVSDDASGISTITWTVYGKIASITKGVDTTILYTYDPAGNRISKSVVHGGDTLTTWYVRDGQGNVLSVYTYGDPAVHGKDLTQTELHIYGSSRLGIWRPNKDVYVIPRDSIIPMPLLGTGDSVTFTRGNKLFELTNHLGNVLVTISDKRFGVTPDSVVRYYLPDVVNANDYYPFGMLQPGRSYAQSGTGYRYGFNGKEKDDEVKGAGDQIDYGMRVYDPRAGRFLSVDPITSKYPGLTPYQFASNTPVQAIDLDGLEAWAVNTRTGQTESGSLDFTLYQREKGWIFGTYRGGVILHNVYKPSTIPAMAFQNHPIREEEIWATDIHGSGWIGLRSKVEASIEARRQEYVAAVGENIRNGPGGAIGYLIDGPRGSFVGATVDQVMLSFEGIPERYSSVMSTPENKPNERDVPYTEMPGLSPKPEDFNNTLHLGAFSNFKNIDELSAQFFGRNLENSVVDLMGNGWTVANANFRSKTVFEKIVGKTRYYAMWEPMNMEHSTDGRPTSYWKITMHRISQSNSSGHVRRVPYSSNFQHLKKK